MAKRQWVSWQDLCEEPYRIFFPLAMLFGLIGIGHWLSFALGWSEKSSAFYHASVQVTGYMFCFIIGFLLTALPRFNAVDGTATSGELGAFLGFLVLQQLFAAAGSWILSEICWILLLVTFLRFIGMRVKGLRDKAKKNAQAGPPVELIWMGLGFLFGLGGAILMILGQLEWVPATWLKFAVPLAQQGFLLGVVVGVGGFLAPRLMGMTLPNVAFKNAPQEVVRDDRIIRIRIHLFAGFLFIMSFGAEWFGWVRAAYLLRAAVVTTELIWLSQCYRLPNNKGTYIKLLWISLWMVMVGLWGAGSFPAHRVTLLHFAFLGGFSLMTFAVGTMVVLSHAGLVSRLHKPLPI